jgi:hypothetical protein
MIGRFGLGAGGAGGGVIFFVPLDGGAGVVFAEGTLPVVLLAFGAAGAQVKHVHNTVISTRTGNNLLFIALWRI